jgi:AAA domain
MGILDRVKKAHEAKLDHMKALVHGNSGSGKSTLCGTLPGPILYAYTEPQGVVSFRRVAPDGDTVHISSVDDVRDLLVTLRNGERDESAGTVCGYRSLAFDSLTEMQRKIMDQYIDRSDGGEKSGDRISISQWGEIIDRTAQLVRSFRDLPLHFIITTLSAEHFVGGEDDAKRVVRPELAGRSLPNTLAQFFNIVGYAYTRTAAEGIDFRVLLGGNVDFLSKGMPGLAYREVPDVAYWIARSFDRCDPRDDDAPMFPWPGDEREPSDDASAATDETQSTPAKAADAPESAPESETTESTPEGDSGSESGGSATAKGNGATEPESDSKSKGKTTTKPKATAGSKSKPKTRRVARRRANTSK